MALLRPHRDERAALAMEDLASALDAGLPACGEATGEPRSPASALRIRGVQIAARDRVILEAAERAGDLPRALRERAASLRVSAELGRSLLASFRYPLLLTVVAVLVGALVGSIAGTGITTLLLASAAPLLLLAVALLVRMALHGTSPLPCRVPVLGPILLDFAELPYLQTLRGLYAAGIPILQAHPQAVEAVPVPFLRQNLEVADHLLQKGGSLAEALESSGALCAETRGLLVTGEAAGDLEGALERASIRRGDTLRHRTERGARLLGRTVYFLAAGLAVYVIFSFYSGLYGRLLHR